MVLNSLWYCICQTAVSLLRNFWLVLTSSAMIAVSLIILGGFLLVAANASQFMRIIESTVEINVFLCDDVGTGEIREIGQKIDGLVGVEGYIFVSKHQALREMKQSLGGKGNLLDGLESENNPLPDSFRVRAEQADLVPALAHQISFYPGVEKVRYGQEYVEKLVAIVRWVNVISLGAVALLAVAAVFLIVTTIRLSVLAREEEIGIMKYLGASNWFIRGPFVMEGMLVGLVGSLTAVIVLGLVYHYLVTVLQRAALLFFLQPVTDPGVLVSIFGGLLVLGVLMGGIGSLISVRKFLRV